jgi:hypothetical protein
VYGKNVSCKLLRQKDVMDGWLLSFTSLWTQKISNTRNILDEDFDEKAMWNRTEYDAGDSYGWFR